MKLHKLVSGKIKAVNLKANDPHKFNCPVMGEVLACLKVGGNPKDAHSGAVIVTLDLAPKFECEPEVWVYAGPSKSVDETNCCW
jgi:hypothetical protein